MHKKEFITAGQELKTASRVLIMISRQRGECRGYIGFV